ncbi:MAG: GNAT family N-acetyltransferase [Clostridia bacterium]|nr:GNAT family N-acetyltransferase [Clostridia bacterium]
MSTGKKTEWKIEPLPREKWAGYALPFWYSTDGYYDVKASKIKVGFQFRLRRVHTGLLFTIGPDEGEEGQDKLYAPWWEKAQAWGVVGEDGQLMAAIETSPEEWTNRLQVTELWVSPALQRQGLGHALMDIAKEQTRSEGRRALILETQSCNVNAIDFYLHEGFFPIGLDTCCYTNYDMERRQVRINMGWIPEEKRRRPGRR